MVLLLIGLVVVAVLSRTGRGLDLPTSAKGHLLWNGFLFGIPLILAGFLSAGEYFRTPIIGRGVPRGA